MTCEGKPLSGVKVKLMESDNSVGGGVFDTDDVMAKGKTDSQGRFSLTGSSKEITGIEPYLAIYHDCKDGLKVNILSIFNSKRGSTEYNAEKKTLQQTNRKNCC